MMNTIAHMDSAGYRQKINMHEAVSAGHMITVVIAIQLRGSLKLQS